MLYTCTPCTQKKFKTNIRFGLKTLHEVIKFNQKAWLKPCIDMNTELQSKVKEKLLEKLFEAAA